MCLDSSSNQLDLNCCIKLFSNSFSFLIENKLNVFLPSFDKVMLYTLAEPYMIYILIYVKGICYIWNSMLFIKVE